MSKEENKSCCSKTTSENKTNYKSHWNTVYSNSPTEKLGWFESDLSPTLRLIKKSGINKSSSILIVGAEAQLW